MPDFRDGRVGRFLHDFKGNQTAIIDESAKRCFVMPLDRNVILPPKSLADVILKMYMGYYDINTTSIRKHMRVVTPALTDLSSISSNIQLACDSMSVYLLEKYEGKGKDLNIFENLISISIPNDVYLFLVFKRSVDISDDGKFVEYSGSFILYDFMNMNELGGK